MNNQLRILEVEKICERLWGVVKEICPNNFLDPPEPSKCRSCMHDYNFVMACGQLHSALDSVQSVIKWLSMYGEKDLKCGVDLGAGEDVQVSVQVAKDDTGKFVIEGGMDTAGVPDDIKFVETEHFYCKKWKVGDEVYAGIFAKVKGASAGGCLFESFSEPLEEEERLVKRAESVISRIEEVLSHSW